MLCLSSTCCVAESDTDGNRITEPSSDPVLRRPPPLCGKRLAVLFTCRINVQAEAQADAKGVDPKDAQLEFFGLAVRAPEIPALVSRMRILSRKV